MALNFYLQLAIEGSAVTGDVTLHTLGGLDVSSNHIEAYALYHETALSADSTQRDVKLNHGPISFTKRADRATPLLLQAMAEQRRVDGAIKFFGHNPDSGETILSHVFEITAGHILGVRTEMLNSISPEGSTMPVLERITLRYSQLKVLHITSSNEVVMQVR